MWRGGVGLTEEERVTRDEARSLLSRTLRMASPFRRTMYAALVCVAERDRVDHVLTLDRTRFRIYRPAGKGRFVILPAARKR